MLRRCCTTWRRAPTLARAASTVAAGRSMGTSGDIGDSFTSISGAEAAPLPDRFVDLKRHLARGKHQKLWDGWCRLLRTLERENETIAARKSDVIPQVRFAELDSDCEKLKDEIQKRGVVVVRGVIPQSEARAYKDEVEGYVRKNPQTRGFPKHDPQVYELYWSAPQLKARSHPAMMEVQQRLMTSLWTSSLDAPISLSHPLTYADRLRIRQPGDTSFALGPHIDGGSVERWEKEGYGRGGVYDKIFEGDWEKYDPFDATTRIDAVNNLYDGPGPALCSGYGRALDRILASASLFTPISRSRHEGFLNASNWMLLDEANMTTELQGASLEHRQELNEELHPHLALGQTMVHIPKMHPGDFVAWHCDSIHAVDKQHIGKDDSSVLYIPVCPLTQSNAEYLARQRDTFRRGTPAPDFPGDEGESEHVDRPSEDMLKTCTNTMGRQAFGLDRLALAEGASPGEQKVVQRANKILGY
ncbi:hypothetical protein ACCO45_002654 [Purpureocillium lilacinum]|uniref:Uncharacterized protein n=1 Tax=Purpureocillium lilacinum TaxID=33203 RepID=A0ACC4EAH2_PURLI